jgi:hypothetical protein
MAAIKLVLEKKTFIPEKNYFKCDDVRVSREETPEEIKLLNNMVSWSNRGMASIGIGILLCLLIGIPCGCWSNTNPWAYLGVAVGILSFIGGFVYANAVCWPKERECDDIRRKWHDEHDEELWAEASKPIKDYNEEQEKIAEAWRAEHPLEELIRACIKDPMSSVEVANLARYYAEEYIKIKNN